MSVPTADPMQPRPYRVQRVRPEIRDTFTLALEPADDSDIPAFATGQFNMLYLFGVGEIPISISGDPAKLRPLLHTTRAVGTVSRAMQRLRPGDMLGVRGPFGSPWPLEQAIGKDVVIAAGGLGLAPLRSTIYQVLARREQFGRVVLLYGARSPDDILYRCEIERWRGRPDIDVAVTVDHAIGEWRGSVGVVTKLLPRAPIDPGKTVAFVCGPEVMMRFTAAGLAAGGVSEEQIYISLERNMKCAIGFCGHCQYQAAFVCRDGPVFQYGRLRHLLPREEI
ncbi:MAG TPA: FAD/NAD(P)-binding protein [Ktedonobacteraceae bacterium]|jgi:NAD(P)H-flavin reductase